jgi:hypothetical protein
MKKLAGTDPKDSSSRDRRSFDYCTESLSTVTDAQLGRRPACSVGARAVEGRALVYRGGRSLFDRCLVLR